jgi:hypothetical protein
MWCVGPNILNMLARDYANLEYAELRAGAEIAESI